MCNLKISKNMPFDLYRSETIDICSWIMLFHPNAIDTRTHICVVPCHSQAESPRVHMDSSTWSKFASCIGWCHTTPLKPNYKGSVCPSGWITQTQDWWTAWGVQLEPFIFQSNWTSDARRKLLMPVTAIILSLTQSVWHIWETWL